MLGKGTPQSRRNQSPAATLVRNAAEMEQALAVRRRVFIEEQGVPEELEIDEHDGDPAVVTSALHVLLRLDGAAIATGRLLLQPDAKGHLHIGRVAVAREHRGKGAGRAVMLALHDLARRRGVATLTLAAQIHAIGFYQRLGYVLRAGPVFLDAGIEHRWMDLRLALNTEDPEHRA
jgi:predicted GNAT family N-acyltransferase